MFELMILRVQQTAQVHNLWNEINLNFLSKADINVKLLFILECCPEQAPSHRTEHTITSI